MLISMIVYLKWELFEFGSTSKNNPVQAEWKYVLPKKDHSWVKMNCWQNSSRVKMYKKIQVEMNCRENGTEWKCAANKKIHRSAFLSMRRGRVSTIWGAVRSCLTGREGCAPKSPRHQVVSPLKSFMCICWQKLGCDKRPWPSYDIPAQDNNIWTWWLMMYIIEVISPGTDGLVQSLNISLHLVKGRNVIINLMNRSLENWVLSPDSTNHQDELLK